ncbi:class I SAM-dependent methyltransferase [Janibacter cremeus]|uniref:Ubiquinone/menaquinone biosynthesis C-methylase UbiE n=1 Tax=Janibacter cremeus TaxID=1285192 RepID=A0A852VME8_9MICO|nr:ubiquinone/menaquinone biosynthesis C-methylase UbiE [Janibacter cremeus]
MNDERGWSRSSGVEANMRTAAVWSQLRELSESRRQELGRPLRVLDLGGGTGGLAVALAEQGHTVTVVDPNPDALASLARRAEESDAAERVSAVQGDADTFAASVTPGSIDLLCCHGVLEYVEDPASTLTRVAEVLAPGGHLSLVTAQRAAAVLARAVAGRFDQATAALTSADGRWGDEDPMPRRFDRADVADMLSRAGFTTLDARGVRIFSDLVPYEYVDTEADRQALLELEELAAGDRRMGLSTLGAAVHVIARRD